MKTLLRHSATNAVCISIFSAFYAWMFLHSESTSYNYIAYAMIALTVGLAAILLSRRQPYDEYHTSILVRCLVAALILTMVAIAALFYAVVNNPARAVEQLFFFAALHWVSVVVCNYAYALLCRRG